MFCRFRNKCSKYCIYEGHPIEQDWVLENECYVVCQNPKISKKKLIQLEIGEKDEWEITRWAKGEIKKEIAEFILSKVKKESIKPGLLDTGYMIYPCKLLLLNSQTYAITIFGDGSYDFQPVEKKFIDRCTGKMLYRREGD